jgi:hypothetical protein
MCGEHLRGHLVLGDPALDGHLVEAFGDISRKVQTHLAHRLHRKRTGSEPGFQYGEVGSICRNVHACPYVSCSCPVAQFAKDSNAVTCTYNLKNAEPVVGLEPTT